MSPPVYPPGSTVVVGEAQEPLCLNAYLTCGSAQATRRVTGPVLAGAYRVLPDLSYEPALVNDVRVETKPFTLTYYLRPDAEWSDGVPLSAEDLLFTLEAIRNPANDVLSRAGYELITQATKVDAKTVRLVFSEPYAAWKTLFPQVLPKHALEGQDFDTALLDSIPVASGPFLFQSWQKGTQLTLARNDGWWGSHDAYLQRIVFRFIQTTSGRVQALLSGEVTLLQPFQQEVPAIQGAPGIAVEWSPGANFEHLDFNVTSSTMPLLGQPWFREAVAYALDRSEAVTVARGAEAPGIEVLDSVLYLAQQKEYKPHFNGYGYDAARVARIMKQNGCVTGGAAIWSCGGVRASIRFATTTGNPFRALAQESLLDRAAEAGIELVPDNSLPGVLFGTRLPARDFDLVMFASPRTGDPYGLAADYGCGGVANFPGYCSTRVTDLLEASDVESNEQPRSALVNRAGRVLAGDLPSIPLYQLPSFVARQTSLVGVVDNASQQGLTWNVEEWRFS